MEVLVGPTFSIEVSSLPEEKHHQAVASRLFSAAEENGGGRIGGLSKLEEESPEDSSDSSSSIGAPDDSDEEEDELENGVVSSKPGLGLASLDSLEETLPIKRGLSNHFSGKSKSFASLSEVSSVSNMKEVEKQENPFNKRRRILMANKWSRKSSFYNWPNPKSMPLLASLNEDDGEEEEDDDDEVKGQQNHVQEKPRLLDGKFKTSFKSYSCFSLTDLQEQQQYQ